MSSLAVLQTTASVLNAASAPRAAAAVALLRTRLQELLEAEAEFDAALAGFHAMTSKPSSHALPPVIKHDDPRLHAWHRAQTRRRAALEALK